MVVNCFTQVQSRRRFFWTTQPDACGSDTICGFECGNPGLSFLDQCGPQGCPPPTNQDGCPEPDLTTRTFLTTEWLRGLIINMLMTDGRLPDNQCGYRPGSQGGHWSESYITNGPATVGTLMRTPPASGRVQDSINLIVAFAKSTVERLVQRGVAISVDVVGKYLGGNKMQLDITVFGRTDGEAKVGITGIRLSQGWVWQ